MVGIGIAFTSTRAWACEACASVDRDRPLVWLSVGAFLVLPFVVAAFAFIAIRRLSAAESFEKEER